MDEARRAAVLREYLNRGPFVCVHAELRPPRYPHRPYGEYVCRFDVRGREVGVVQEVPIRLKKHPSTQEIAAAVEYRLLKHLQDAREGYETRGAG